MKKLLVVLLALTMLLSVLSLASCGGKGKGDAETGETTAEQTEFTVGWKNWNGDFIKVDPKVAKGTLPVFGQADPTRPEDDDYVYTFAGWEPAIAPVTANVIYTATYTATEKSKTTITADQFNAMWSSFGGKNLVVNAENIYIRHSLSMLEDGSHYVTSVYAEENTTVYHVGVPMPDGKIAVFSGMLNKKSGVIEWEFDDVITAGEFIAEQTNKSGGVLAGFGAYKPYASNFADYTYDEAGEFYRANGTVDDFNWEVKLWFEGGRLKKANFAGMGTYTFEYGTATIPQDVVNTVKDNVSVSFTLKGDRDFDDEHIPMVSFDGTTIRLRASFKVTSQPTGFNPKTGSVAVALLFANLVGEDEGKIYTDEDLDIKVLCAGKEVGEYLPDDKAYLILLNPLKDGDDYVGTYVFDITLTVKKPLATEGDNVIVVKAGFDS